MFRKVGPSHPPSVSVPCARLSLESYVVPNRDDGTYLPQQRAPHTPLPSSAPPAVRQHTRPPAHTHTHAPAPALTHSYSSSPPHTLSPLTPSGSVPPPLTFPTPSVLGGYGPSRLVRPPSPPMTEQATTTWEYNVQGTGYQNVAAPGISQQRSAAVGRGHRACIVSGVAANYT